MLSCFIDNHDAGQAFRERFGFPASLAAVTLRPTFSGASASVAVDAGSGTNRALFAFVCRENFATLDTFTYNGSALTNISTTTGPPTVRAD